MMIDALFDAAGITDDGINIRFELSGYKFRFAKSGRGLMRKRRQASSIFQIESSPTEPELDAINAFMTGFNIENGNDKWNINEAFSLDDFFAIVPEVVDSKPVQLEMMQSLHVTAAMAILGNESARALMGVSESSASTDSAESLPESTDKQNSPVSTGKTSKELAPS